MASGKVRSPVPFDFPVTDGSFLIYAHNMPVECPFGSDMEMCIRDRNVSRVKATVKDFREETNMSVIT